MAWPAINGYNDGECVEESVLNRPIQQLAARTEHLRAQLAALSGGTTYVDVDLYAQDAPYSVGDVVYRMADRGSYAKALARTEQLDVFYAAPEAMAVGVIASIEGTRARVILSGAVKFPGVRLRDLIETDGALPTSGGRCYLSARTPGRVTVAPSGPVIYIGDYRDEADGCSILVNPQYRDTGESHVHRAFVLTGRPRGPITTDAGGTRITGIGEFPSTDNAAYDRDGWTLGSQDGSPVLRLDLQAHPEVLRFLPLAPENSVSLQIDGVEARGRELFPNDCEWSIEHDDASTWLVWHTVSLEGAVLPFSVDAVGAPSPHYVVLYAAKALVGPTGFVTSLDVIPGSPLRVVSRSSSATAHQGDLQIGLDVDFSTVDGNERGFNVLKRVSGSTFVSGPVVERIVCGPGLSLISHGGSEGQGTVELAVDDSAYTGDFETIALENAKQALVGGFFPYTRLLGWTTEAASVRTAFTAKFRVPDTVPDEAGTGYNVVLSMSVFGETDIGSGTSGRLAGVHLESGVLPDFSTTDQATSFNGGVRRGARSVIDIPFASGYRAYDPIWVHGFTTRAVVADAQHVLREALLLRDGDGAPFVVHPGWFVGVRIARGAPSGDTPYTDPLGIVSLRWTLLKAGGAA